MSRAKSDFWVDVAICIAGVISAISGLVFLLPANPASGILGVSLRAWSTLHTWSSLAALAGVGAHLALHWKWMTVMARQMLPSKKGRQVTGSASEAVRAGSKGAPMSRRAFLAIGGIGAVAAGLSVAGYKVAAQAASTGGTEADSSSGGSQNGNSTGGTQGENSSEGILGDDSTGGTEGDSSTGGTATATGGVACPRGLVNDPYPGQCRLYVDSNGDGICDYSVAGSGSEIAGDSAGSLGEGFRQRGNRGRP